MTRSSVSPSPVEDYDPVPPLPSVRSGPLQFDNSLNVLDVSATTNPMQLDPRALQGIRNLSPTKGLCLAPEPDIYAEEARDHINSSFHNVPETSVRESVIEVDSLAQRVAIINWTYDCQDDGTRHPLAAQQAGYEKICAAEESEWEAALARNRDINNRAESAMQAVVAVVNKAKQAFDSFPFPDQDTRPGQMLAMLEQQQALAAQTLTNDKSQPAVDAVLGTVTKMDQVASALVGLVEQYLQQVREAEAKAAAQKAAEEKAAAQRAAAQRAAAVQEAERVAAQNAAVQAKQAAAAKAQPGAPRSTPGPSGAGAGPQQLAEEHYRFYSSTIKPFYYTLDAEPGLKPLRNLLRGEMNRLDRSREKLNWTCMTILEAMKRLAGKKDVNPQIALPPDVEALAATIASGPVEMRKQSVLYCFQWMAWRVVVSFAFLPPGREG